MAKTAAETLGSPRLLWAHHKRILAETSMVMKEWRPRLEAIVEAEAPAGDGSHDLGHCRRVWRVANEIADALPEDVDRLILLAAAYLHDIVAVEKNDPRRPHASRLAANRAREILTELQFPAEKIEPVAHAIEAHSFAAQIEPQTLEAMILQDADRMETLGAIGVARIFYVGGRIGSKLFDENDPLARDRALDDLTYSLDHFYTKILHLPDSLKTAPGRAIAARRNIILEQFLACLLAEIGMEAATR